MLLNYICFIMEGWICNCLSGSQIAILSLLFSFCVPWGGFVRLLHHTRDLFSKGSFYFTKYGINLWPKKGFLYKNNYKVLSAKSQDKGYHQKWIPERQWMDVDFTKGKQPRVSVPPAVLCPSLSLAEFSLISFCTSSIYSEGRGSMSRPCHLWSVE